MIEIITLAIITSLSSFAFGYLIKAHNESGWKQMYLYEQKRRVLAEESRDKAYDYVIRLENRLIAQQKDLESLQGRKRDMLTELYCARAFLLGEKSTCATEDLPRRIDRAIKIGEM